jgi:hypothetical protein
MRLGAVTAAGYLRGLRDPFPHFSYACRTSGAEKSVGRASVIPIFAYFRCEIIRKRTHRHRGAGALRLVVTCAERKPKHLPCRTVRTQWPA